MIRENAYFVQYRNIFCWSVLLPARNFSATMVSTYSSYRLRAVASLKVLAIENMHRITVELRIVY